MLDLNI